jgi:hypothetical protein
MDPVCVELRNEEEQFMSAITAITATTLMTGVLLAGLSGVLAAAPPATVAEQGHTEKALAGPSTTKASTCPAWWITHDGLPGNNSGKTNRRRNVQKPGKIHVQTPIPKPPMQKPGPKPSPR